ncbi:MAG: FkbM family methyltransferase [Chloroflexota bacterium]
MPLARPLLVLIQNWRARRLKRQKVQEAQAFEKFIQAAFSNVENGSLVVRIPNLGGTYEIDFRSHILLRVLRKKAYEPELVDLAAQYLDPERDILDIGANVGLLTVFFAHALQAPQKVLAVEPTPLAQYYLRRNIERNGVGNMVIVFDGLVTEKPGSYELHLIPGKEEYSSLGDIVHKSTTGEQSRIIQVLGETMDNLTARYRIHPGFVKIDTEGAELFVLRGATRTLQQERPVLLMELSDRLLASLGCSSRQVFDLLRENSYHLVNADDPAGAVGSPYEGSILALPERKGRRIEPATSLSPPQSR